MGKYDYSHQLEELIACRDIHLNGNRPWDIQVHDPRLAKRILTEGSLGLGESYIDGWWDCEQLDDFFFRVLAEKLDCTISCRNIMAVVRAHMLNPQKVSKAFQIGEYHYDIGNDLYQRMLDSNMQYSCAYWKDADSLEQAQQAKMDLVCRKLYLQPGMQILDIGCGWGGMARYAAENYGVSVVGITVSKEQRREAEKRCQGLDVTIRMEDYRSLNGSFDRILSVGMFEHVGYKNYKTFMDVVRRNLKNDGLFLLHTIGSLFTSRSTDPWIEKYIFPHSHIPSICQIAKAAEPDWIIEDLHNFGTDYDKTLMCWFENFDSSWPELQERYGQRFYRMWKYYLLVCAGSFRARKNQLWQIVCSPGGGWGDYIAVR